MSEKANLKTIAEEAGVSVTTVSGILNGKKTFSEERQRQIWEIAHRLNYHPDGNARLLRQAGDSRQVVARTRTGIILHLSYLPEFTRQVAEPVESYRTYLMLQAAQKSGLSLLHYWYDEAAAFSCRPLIDGLIDGAIVGTPHAGVIEALRRHHLPLVLLDVPFNCEYDHSAVVNFDLRQGMSLILRKLRDLGHRRIALFRVIGCDPALSESSSGNNPHIDYHGIRWFKAIEANAAIGLEVDEKLSYPQRLLTPESHRQVIREFVAAAVPEIRNGGITAIVCMDDIYAVTMVEELAACGLKVPDDVSVTGFWHPPFSASRITSASCNWEEGTGAAVRLLKTQIEQPKLSGEEVLIKMLPVDGDTVRPVESGEKGV